MLRDAEDSPPPPILGESEEEAEKRKAARLLLCAGAGRRAGVAGAYWMTLIWPGLVSSIWATP